MCAAYNPPRGSMGGKAKIALALVIGALMVTGGAGCGGGDSSASEFLTPGGDNSIQTFGKEAGTSELQSASKALEAFMAARGGQDWETACSQLAAEAFEPLEGITAPGSGCVGTLAAVAKRLGQAAWTNTMTGPIAALRHEGERAFALYHGTADTDYFIQMTYEGGEWKVAALEPTAFP
jgi:hypothetical protein